MSSLQVFFDWQQMAIRRRLAQPIQRAPRPRAATLESRYPTSLPVATRGPYLKQSTAQHGTMNRYTHGKCRCDRCKTVHARYQHAYHLGQQQQRQQDGAA